MEPAHTKQAVASQYQPRLLTVDDGPLMRALFRKVFGHEMTPALWNWKYAHPYSCGAGVFSKGELVAHYGGIGRRVLLAGEELLAIQIADVMVAPTVRRSVRGNSPFYLGFTTFVSAYVGYGKRYPIGFGFPSNRHMKLAGHLGLYAPVGTMSESSWPAKADWRNMLLEAVPVTTANFSAHSKVLEALWESQAKELASKVVGIRDPQWLLHRYLQHPEHNYMPVLVRHRLTRQTLGLLVLKMEAGKSLLMDLIAPQQHFPQLLRCAAELAHRAGKASLYAWHSTPFNDLFACNAASQSLLPITTPANIWSPGPPPEQVRDLWWLMAGDTDFL